jgi:hypothetical protein
VTFNHGVEGSSPSALTNKINTLYEYADSDESRCVCAVSANELPRAVRRALALPVYTVALILDFISAALGRLAARIAGDDWPE